MDAITWRCTTTTTTNSSTPAKTFATVTWTRRPDGAVCCRLLLQGGKQSHGYSRPGSGDLCALAFENACRNLGVYVKRPLAGRDDIQEVLALLASRRGVESLTVHRQG